MPLRPSSRSTRHPDEPPRGREKDAADPSGEPLEDGENELDATESPQNEQLPDHLGDEDLDPPVLDDDPPVLDDDPAVLDKEEEDGDEAAQRFAEDSVKEDMATAAVHPQTHVGVRPGEVGPVPGAAALAPGAWSQLSDAEIMLRVAAGDEAGFSLLVEKYRRQMVHYMYRMVHNQAVAEELAQEVFLRVYRARASYRAEAKFSTWLYRIATNLGVNHARDTRHERGAHAVYLDQPDPETGISPDVADTTPTVEQNMLREARLAAIRKHVMALPERQRTAVLMHKYQDLDYKQIGAVLKLSESATKSLLFRAYQTLRERLKEFI
jgi:RNA polymerase sigma-70 factor (ECF subfamily)